MISGITPRPLSCSSFFLNGLLEKKQPFINKCVFWLRGNEENKFVKLIHRILAIALGTILALTIVGIPILFQAKKIWETHSLFFRLINLPSGEDRQIHVSFNSIIRRSHKNTKLAHIALAGWINKNKIPLNKLELSPTQLSKVGEHITFLDLRGKNHTYIEIKQYLECCPKAKFLYLNSGAIKKIPQLPSGLELLDCSKCTKIKVLPDLPITLKHLICNWCEDLKKLPNLPRKIRTLDCNSCISLEKISSLPNSLLKLNCSWCVCLEKLPSLPKKIKILDCCFCSSLKDLPRIPQQIQQLNISWCKRMYPPPKIPPTLKKVKGGMNANYIYAASASL